MLTLVNLFVCLFVFWGGGPNSQFTSIDYEDHPGHPGLFHARKRATAYDGLSARAVLIRSTKAATTSRAIGGASSTMNARYAAAHASLFPSSFASISSTRQNRSPSLARRVSSGYSFAIRACVRSTCPGGGR